MKRKTYSENQPKSFDPENLIEVNPDSWRESDWRGFFVMISDAQKKGDWNCSVVNAVFLVIE